MNTLRPWLWCVPLLLTANEACAWGLVTHTYFAQILLWAVPLADPAFRRAARRFPRLVLTGASLPDLALVSRLGGVGGFQDSHEWSCASVLLSDCRDDGERALALGFVSHLLTDVLAHNHYVPTHETLWAPVPHVTHALCEWTLDHHLHGELFAPPGELLAAESGRAAAWTARHFGGSKAAARKAIGQLAGADQILRASRLPRLAHAIACRLDRRMQRRMHHFLRETVARLPQINALLAGETPAWAADVCPEQARAGLAGLDLAHLRNRLPLPQDLFAPTGGWA